MEVNLFSVALLADILSCSVGCLFILFMVSFAVQKFLSLIMSHLSIFVFISFTLGNGSKRSFYNFCQRVFCLYFHLKVIVSDHIFRYLIYPEGFFFFWYGIIKGSNFIILHVMLQFYPKNTDGQKFMKRCST